MEIVGWTIMFFFFLFSFYLWNELVLLPYQIFSTPEEEYAKSLRPPMENLGLMLVNFGFLAGGLQSAFKLTSAFERNGVGGKGNPAEAQKFEVGSKMGGG